MQSLIQRYFGPKDFYQRTARVAIPLALQQLLSSAMGIVDTLMVSWIGMVTAVGTAAQIDTLCSMIAYGSIGGTGMFSSQFYGAKDYRNLKRVFGFSIVLGMINALFWLVVSMFFGEFILRFYMDDPQIIQNGLLYLNIAMFSFVPSCISFAFSYIYRSIQKASIPLKVSIVSMLVNAGLNYALIFGVGPFPEMGVQGAALGTVLAQCFAVAVYTIHGFITKQPFLGSFTEMFSFDRSFVMPILRKIAPLIFNETLFGFGSTLFVKAFGVLGTQAMDAYYVGNQISNVFLFVVYGYGNAISVLLGGILGQGKIEEARREGDYYCGLSAILAVVLVTAMIVFAGPMVSIFQLQDPVVIGYAEALVMVFAVKISMRLFNFMIFSVLRSGGDSKIISVLDSDIMWVIGIPLAFICVHLFKMQDIALVFLVVQLEQLVRLVIGMKRFNSGLWANDLTSLIAS